jgi:PHAX RNA-binding domain-containing protein
MDAVDTLTPQKLAAALQEPNTLLLGRCLRRLGQERCQTLLTDTLTLEAHGGMLIKDGTRRRTPGGTFFQLVRDRCTSKERHFIFAPLPATQAVTSSKTPNISQATDTAPVDLTLDLWKGLRPMAVTATLKLVLRELPETREHDGMVFMALHNEPRGLPKNITLEAAPLYLTSPAKQWRAACTKAEQIRQAGTPALLIVEAHVSTKEDALVGVVKGVQVVEGRAPAQPQA